MSQAQSTNSDFNEDEDDEEDDDTENCDNSVGESEDGKKCEEVAKKLNENEKSSMFSKNFYKLISQNSQLQEQFHQYSLANFQNSDFLKSKKSNDCVNVAKSLNEINKSNSESDVIEKCDSMQQYTNISPQSTQVSVDNLTSVNNLVASQTPLQVNHGSLLAQFMSPAAFAAAMFYNSSKPNNLLVPINPNNVTLYQKNYLEALNFYKAACNGNGVNATSTN